MAFGQVRSRMRALSVGAALGVACGAFGACSLLEPDIIQSSIRADTPELDADIQEWLQKLSPGDRAVIENEIRWRKDLLIHVVEADLPEKDSRGGASSLAASDFSKERCRQHPKVEGVPRSQDWNVFVDRPLAEKWAKRTGIPNPPDVILHHEIRGHILLLLRNPKYIKFLMKKGAEAEKGATPEVREKAKEEIEKFREFLEKKAREIENEYRRQYELKEVPDYLPESSEP